MSVNNDIARHDCLWLIHYQFWVVQIFSNVSVHAIISWRWSSHVLPVPLKNKLSPWIYVTQEHCFMAIASSYVVVALR